MRQLATNHTTWFLLLICWSLVYTGPAIGKDLPPFLTGGSLDSIPADVSQLLVAAGKSGAREVRVYALERKAESGWTLRFGPLSGTIGYNGFAAPGAKREGDGRSPSGSYPAGFAFGYAPGVDTRMPYRQVTASHFWDTDPRSPRYNSWIEGAPAVRSYEKMRRRDQQYSLGLVIEYNMHPVVPGFGSAIFLHVWRGPGLPTAGCIGVSRSDMQRILDWLDPVRKPMIVMGSEALIRGGRLDR